MASGLLAYLDSVKARDPAPRSRWEILLYPGVWALFYHRIAHWLFQGELYFLARLVNHWSRMVTAIDIHPGRRDRPQLLHRPRLRRDRRDRRDRRRRHHLPAGHPGRHQPDQRRSAASATRRSATASSSARARRCSGRSWSAPRARIGANAVVTRDVPAGRDHGRHPGPLDPGRRRAELGAASCPTARPAPRRSTRRRRSSKSSSARSSSCAPASPSWSRSATRLEGRASKGRNASNRSRA